MATDMTETETAGRTAAGGSVCVNETHKWTEDECRLFIQMRDKHNMKFKSGKRGASRDAFTIILKEMDLLDKVTPEQARKKWTNLSQKYKELKHPPTGTGTEEGEDTPVSWSYFQDMDKVLGGKTYHYSTLSCLFFGDISRGAGCIHFSRRAK
ncbi:uncharacterized protein LOC119725830 [Patiria miniata]|uniref:Myb/SANT-like DNA-binding domain-containing protein n=1 Tax=Patiria miniata TaxID=46514 RepID=A0A913ZQJ7_PATMI|nr:uncharacterized protein LOC119725830 [Patiria miniata]